MKEIFIRKLQRTSTHSYVVNIPKELINKFNWREKQKVEVVFRGKRNELLVKGFKKTRKKKKK